MLDLLHAGGAREGWNMFCPPHNLLLRARNDSNSERAIALLSTIRAV